MDAQSGIVSDESGKPALLGELSEERYQEIKRTLLSSHGCSTSERDRAKYLYGHDESLRDVLRREIRSHVFGKFPLRLIDLRSSQRKFKERSAVAEYLCSEKLAIGVERIKRIEHEAFENAGRTAMAAPQRAQLRDRAIAECVEEVATFAILSHTWEPVELTYKDLHNQDDLLGSHSCQQDSNQDSGRRRSLEKLRKFCEIAVEYGTEFAWADNVCIDKSSSAELDESIRSMFSWYHYAAICVVYLSQTRDFLDLVHDQWFTRGWTLQELLAPQRLKFYNQDWRPLTESSNDKIDTRHHKQHSIDLRLFRQLELLGCAIHKATGLTLEEVCKFKPGIRDPSVPERMKWAARRDTSREEDESYSLMGIFNVSISTAYGEGRERAFFRLFQAILQIGCERDWFLWTGRPVSPSIHPSRMIPSSPKCYSTRKVDSGQHPSDWGMVSALEKEPLSLTNVGLPMKILFVPVDVFEQGRSPRPGDLSPQALAKCHLSSKDIKIGAIRRDDQEDNWFSVQESKFALGFLNVNPEEDSVPCPNHLYAILLRRTSEPPESWKRCSTDKVIVLERDNKFKLPISKELSARQALSTERSRTEMAGFWMTMTL